MGSDNQMVVLHKTLSEKIAEDKKAVIVLSPRHYTLKIERLPLRFGFEAKRVAPSLFEGLLEEGGEYDFLVKKLPEGLWQFIAYDRAHIENVLRDAGAAPKQIKKIVFAQSLLPYMDAPVALDEEAVLADVEGIATVMPKALLDEEPKPLSDLNIGKLPGIGLRGGSGSLIGEKEGIVLALLLFALGGIFVAEGLRYESGDMEVKKLEELLDANPSLASGYTREAILKKYRLKDRTERRKREMIKSLSELIFKGVRLRSLQIESDRFVASLQIKDDQTAKKVSLLAKENGFEPLRQDATITIKGKI